MISFTNNLAMISFTNNLAGRDVRLRGGDGNLNGGNDGGLGREGRGQSRDRVRGLRRHRRLGRRDRRGGPVCLSAPLWGDDWFQKTHVVELTETGLADLSAEDRDR